MVRGLVNVFVGFFICVSCLGNTGDFALYGPLGWYAGGAIVGGANSALKGGTPAQVSKAMNEGALYGLAGGVVLQGVSQVIGNLFSGAATEAPTMVPGELGPGDSPSIIESVPADLNAESPTMVPGAGMQNESPSTMGPVQDEVPPEGNATINMNSEVPTNYYPPNRGFIPGQSPTILDVGTPLIQYGEGGAYFSTPGTLSNQLSLPYSNTQVLNSYQVIQPLPVMQGTAAPWFGQPGGGTQILSPENVQWLILNGYIK